jgi:hypothetical protein
MVPCPNSQKNRLAAVFLATLLAGPIYGLDVPADTELHLRLKTKVSTATSKPGDPVEAMLIAPVMINGQFAIPAGTIVRGTVQEVKTAAKPDERALLGIKFSELDLGKSKVKLASRLANVENAREQVDAAGNIQGILASETITSRLDQGISKVASKYSGLADVLGAIKGGFMKESVADVDYEPGVELDLKLLQPISVSPSGPSATVANLQPVDKETELVALATGQPFQTVAENPPKPSDMTNLMFIGSEAALRTSFEAAGWTAAAAMTSQSKLETFRAIAEQRGYKEAPVSVLLLDGQKPDLVFQKQNNTFARRHHLRIWRREATFEGQPVWLCAATHDTGIDFSPENRTFIHRIDPQIDRERAKVVNDLLLTGKVRSLALVERPAVPKQSRNATGDSLETDGRVAVLILK